MSSLADMSVDEFMASGFEDEESSKVTSTLSPPVVTKRKSKCVFSCSSAGALGNIILTNMGCFYSLMVD